MIGDICWYCDGTGEIDCISRAPCPWCDGAGWIEDEDYYEDSSEDIKEDSEYENRPTKARQATSREPKS